MAEFSMTPEEQEAFLADVHIGILAVEGPLVLDDSPRDHLEMAIRYLGLELGRWYTDSDPRGEGAIVVRLVPERWRTKDYGKRFPGGTDAS